MRGRDAVSGVTMGVEEEFLLVDPATGGTVPRASRVLARAAEAPPRAPGAEYHAELVTTQVEAVTGVCRDLPSLARQLREGRRVLARAAAGEGLALVSSGTPVPATLDPPFADGDRFSLIAERYAGMVVGYESCGCHVHVGVPERETAVAVVNHLRPWLPTLLALSANSPFDRGRDSGYASWRMVGQARFPGSGVTPWFPSAQAYERGLDRLVDCGVLVDRAMTFWLARPSSHLPTVEVRVADAAATVDEAVLQAALTRALVRRAVADLETGREAPRPDDQVCAAALWAAARHGLGGPGVHPLEEVQVPAWRLVDELLDRVRTALEESGDLSRVTALLARLRRGGTGADRQRRAGGSGGAEVVAMLIRETVAEEWLPEERVREAPSPDSARTET
ncbi:carboxylate-amine ligase [Thermomonospora umbrina]|uniref:Putative glutamate--cysteine ligase 2 n=1 Tax=Thermomonospora umbrina TaxID=111806 RepID=A0A3D9T1I6_9ACTN|nr:glutamate--cysteine ligase [Thermomonospora umbrina]REF00184.1 carboxylate-amine ligase [Thermomonospora umbrina]